MPNSNEKRSEDEGIGVFLRIRPSKKRTRYIERDDIDENKIIFHIPKAENLIVDNSRTKYAFLFNAILDETAKQDEVFKKVGAPAVQNAIDGFNSTVFAYGQTGSGKTFTITGGPERYVDRGIIPRSISMIMDECSKRKNVTYSYYISYLELYNESGFDLLAAEHTEVSKLEDMPKVIMREDEDGNLNFKNLSVNPVANEEEALNLLFLGDTNRAIGETEMNQASSRSHCIFTILLECRKQGSDSVIRSKLNLVDLAGSERVHKTTSTGQVLREAQYINTSLFFLEMVIIALHEKEKKGKEKTHIPYRNSMMTSVLRDSLGGNCKTLMIATISPEIKQTDESISTCNFAQRVALVKNTAQINEELEPELIIQRLKTELHRQREEIKFLRGENGEEDDLTTDERSELGKLVRIYLACKDNTALNIGRITLTKINEVFVIFKQIVLEAFNHKSGNLDNSAIDEMDDLKEQIDQYQRKLKQREQEINILVHMVKKGKKMGNTGLLENNSTTIPQSDLGKSLNIAHNSRISKICGVERCSESKVLGDPSVAFAWFMEKSPATKAIEENKTILKIKYQEVMNQAKDLGAIVLKSKNTINYIKATIAQLRRERSMEDAFFQNDEIMIKNDELTPEEMQHRNEMEKQKIIYKDGFNKLKALKVSIEHIQMLMEKARKKAQVDFDIWYREMCGEQQVSLNSYKRLANDADEEKELSTLKQKQVPLPQYESAYPKDSGSLGIQMTGNKEADADIIAFFKAKDALLARSKLQATTSN